MLFKKVEQLVEHYKKPVAPVVLTETKEREFLTGSLKMPIFWAPENAMRALKFSYMWETRPRPGIEISPPHGIRKEKAEDIIEGARGRDHLLMSESLDLLANYGFPLSPHALAGTPEEALKAWKDLRGPVAMKLNRPHVLHKTDAGALRLDLDSKEQIKTAFHDLQAIEGADTEVLIQTMQRNGREVILGGKRDPTFGPIILFGLGGIFVEVLEDVVWRMAPISRDEAREMIRNIRGGKILEGIRGETPYAADAVEDMLLRLSQMLLDFPVIRETDINPVMVFSRDEGALVLDARVHLSPE